MRGLVKYIFSLLIITCSLPGIAQNMYRIELDIKRSDFRIVDQGEGLRRVETDQKNYYYPEEPGSPALPLRNVNILVPNGAELAGFDFSIQEESIEQNILLEKPRSPMPFSLLQTKGTAEPAHFTENYPEEQVKHIATRIQNGYTFFSFAFSPFRYRAENGELSMVNKLTLDVEYGMNTEQTSLVRPGNAVRQFLATNLVNPEAMDQLYPSAEPALMKSAEDPVDYLIITTEELMKGFEPLLNWKRRKGLKAKLITLEEILTIYDEPGTQLAIKRCLYDYYNRHNLQWALLGGDHDVIPVQGCYTKLILNGIELVDDSIPTDLFYACFDNSFNWNSTEDEKIGQLYWDHNDLLPEIQLSRIPVSNMEEVETFIRKTLSYEMNPPVNGLPEELLLAGIESWSSWDGKSDNHHRSESMVRKYIEKNWSGREIRFFDTGTDFPEDHEYHVTATNLANELNKGYGIFHFAGHGNREGLSMESGRGFYTMDASQLRNQFPGIMLSTACDVNSFDSPEPCLSEAFLENPSGGALAFFGSSRYGFGYQDQVASLGPSFSFNATFLKHLFESDMEITENTFAGIAARTKSNLAYNGSHSGTYHYLQYAVNAMGDPELPIHTKTPSLFENVRLYKMEDALTVNTGGIRNCRICITSQDLGYQKVVQGVSYYTFEDVPEAFQVCITAPNHIPYQYVSGTISAWESSLSSRIRIYPNPVSEYLNIQVGLPALRLQLYDMRGRLLMEQEMPGGNTRLNLSCYPEGTYILRILSDEGIARFKVLKQASAQGSLLP